MAYTRKTRDVYLIMGNYGSGYEEVTEEETMKDARQMLKCYRENVPQHPHKIVVKRIKIQGVER